MLDGVRVELGFDLPGNEVFVAKVTINGDGMTAIDGKNEFVKFIRVKF